MAAQTNCYPDALDELRQGDKLGHWMWFVFPQIDGLGHSDTARRYAIQSPAEARAFLQHPTLGPRLLECCEALLSVEGKSAREILGSPDDLKLRSCATLFSQVAPQSPVFHRLISRFFSGLPDPRTIEILKALSAESPDGHGNH